MTAGRDPKETFRLPALTETSVRTKHRAPVIAVRHRTLVLDIKRPPCNMAVLSECRMQEVFFLIRQRDAEYILRTHVLLSGRQLPVLPALLTCIPTLPDCRYHKSLSDGLQVLISEGPEGYSLGPLSRVFSTISPMSACVSFSSDSSSFSARLLRVLWMMPSFFSSLATSLKIFSR